MFYKFYDVHNHLFFVNIKFISRIFVDFLDSTYFHVFYSNGLNEEFEIVINHDTFVEFERFINYG